MHPLSWFRWKLLAALAGIAAILYFLGIDPLARWQINRLGTEHRTARWNVSEVALGFLTGDFQLEDVLVAAARDAAEGGADEGGGPREKVMDAEEVVAELSAVELLRKRFVVDALGVRSPRIELRRREDGSTNLGDLAGEEDEPAPSSGKGLEDWVETAKKWYERLEGLRERLPGRKGEDEGAIERERRDQEKKSVYERRVLYPFAERPAFVARRIFAEAVVVSFSEESASGEVELPRLEDASIELTGLSSRPAAHNEPIALSLGGKLGGAPLELSITVDFTSGEPRYAVDLSGDALPVQVVGAFIGRSLPVRLEKGEIGVRAGLALDGKGTIDAAPALTFRGVELGVKPGSERVAGFPAADFVKAFNEASRALEGAPLTIADLRISGTLALPRFEWGDTVRALVVEGGKAFAMRQLARGRERLESEAADEIEKARQKLGKELEGTPGGEAAKEVLEGILPGKDAAKDAAGAALEGIKGVLGGSKDTTRRE